MRSRAALLVFSIVVIDPTSVVAQPNRPHPRSSAGAAATGSGVANTRDFADHFGLAMAKRLTESADSSTRLRGIERAAAVGSPDAVTLLTKLAESASLGRGDAREALQVVRALAPFADQTPVRKALLAFVISPAMGGAVAFPGRSLTFVESSDPSARFELARHTAALAIAQSNEPTDLLRMAQIDGAAAQAAREALLSGHLPPTFTFVPSAFSRVPAIELAAQLGDPRVAPILRNAHPGEAAARAATIETLAELGDPSALTLAREALADKSPRLRIAGARAFAMLDAPERYKAVAALIDDDATLDAGVSLAEETQDAAITKALAQRLATSTSIDLRRSILVALARSDSLDALRVLAAFVKDTEVGSDAARAIAASANSVALVVIEKMIADPSTSRLGVRAYVVRAAATGESSSAANDAIASLARSRDGAARALGAFAQLISGRGDVDAALTDSDARVRRAAAVALLDERFAKTRKILLDRLPTEKDEAARQLAAIGLLDPSARGRVPTLALGDRAKSGGADAPLATLARASRKAEADDPEVDAALASIDPVMRAHAAVGLGQSAAPDATGILANAYAYETDALVRRAVVTAIAGALPADSVSRLSTLRLAARLDPDRAVRMIADRALHSLSVTPPPAVTTMAWIRLATEDGTKPPAGMLGSVVRSDGLAVPIAFDDDGFALVPGMPPGEARLVLAPRLPSDKDAGR